MRRLGAAAASLAILALSACGGDTSLPGAVEVTLTTPSTTTAPAPPKCSQEDSADIAAAVRSFAPLAPMPVAGEMPPGSTMAAIHDSGRLIVGVSADTWLFGARNPVSNRLEGFDVDIAREVALAIFGGAYDDIDTKIEYKVLTTAQRLPALTSGSVNLIARTMTITCDRWLQVNFSTVYFQAGQRVLVKKGSNVTAITELDEAHAKVCALEGSTNLARMQNYGGIVVVPRKFATDCLVALQQGEADAVTSDDTILAGLAAQDPNTEVVGDTFSQEPYGLGIAKSNVDFTEFVNGVLEQIRANGRWTQIFDRWLHGILPDAAPPAPTYGRQP